MFPQLGQRVLQPEQMDDLSVTPSALLSALAGLERVNRISLFARPFFAALQPLLDATPDQHPLSIADIGCGGGQLLQSLDRWASQQGKSLSLIGVDRNPHFVSLATERTRHRGNFRFVELEVLQQELPVVDVVVCSLFLHHFTLPQVKQLLSAMQQSARQKVVVVDLRRSLLNLVMAYIFPRIFSRSPIVHEDALLSVRGAFTDTELCQALEDIAPGEWKLSSVIPERVVIELSGKRS